MLEPAGRGSREKGEEMNPGPRQTISGRAVALVAALVLPWLAACDPPPTVRITTPVHGAFLGASAQTVQVSGTIDHVAPADAALTVNGLPVTVQPDKTFSAVVAI